MKKKRLLFFLLISLFIMSSCGKKEKQLNADEFSGFISAYTSGELPTNASIVVELVNEQKLFKKGDVIDKELFKFTPTIKGVLRCVNEKLFEFIPDQSEMKRGTTYKASFDLGKLIKVAPKFQKFNFSFKIQEQDLAILLESVIVEQQNKSVAKVTGKLKFRDTEKLENAEKALKITRGKETFTAKIKKETDREYEFSIENIAREEYESTLLIEANNKLFKINREIKKEILIPGRAFKFLEYQFSLQNEKCVQLSFSDPISTSQDLRGIITVKGVKSYKIEKENNLINIYYEENINSNEIAVTIDQSLKNSDGQTLKVSSSFTESLKQIPPQLKFLSEKTLLPSEDNLLIPFKAVNLYAVELRIIKIYENNILMFLQDNNLDEGDYIRRSGRLIHKELIRLDTEQIKNIQLWNNYSIDISKYIKQEPGAIYQVRLTASLEHSAYRCADETEEEYKERSKKLQTISTKKTDLEDDEWDTPRAYYYSNNYNWNTYSWKDKDDPCTESYYMEENCRASTNILASDIGIIVKANSEHHVWIAVNNILTTAPIPNAEITVYDFQLQKTATTKSDKNGFAYIESKHKPFVIIASNNEQKTYLKLSDGKENNLSRLDVGGKQNKKGLKGFIYGERGIWRPGDTLYISFMLDDRAKKIPQEHPVTFELYNARGQFYSQQTSTQGVNGVYTFTVPTQESDPTGIWNAYIKVGGTSFHKPLQVETIRPNRLKIDLELPKGELLEAYEKTNTIKVKSAWLTGAKSENLKTDAKIYLRKTHTPFKNYKNYNFNNPTSTFDSNSFELFSGEIDNNGEGTFTFAPPQATNTPGMLQANIVCYVYEPGGDPNIATKTTRFSPFSSYVGINLNNDDKSSDFETDTDLVFDVIRLSPQGKPIDDSSLEYKVYKMSWSWWWENNSDNFSSYIHNSSITPIDEGFVSTKEGKGQLRFRIDYPEWGRYFIYLKDKKSGHATGGAVFIDWPSWRGRSSKPDPNSLKIVPFSLSKKSYECDEEVTAIIPKSSKGRALITIENGQDILSREWIELSDKEDTKYSFKASKEMTPNVYIHLTLLQHYKQTVNDLPIRMYGVMPVFINNKVSVLKPEINMEDVLQPEQEFSIEIKEKNNRAMTYTLAIVDEGLLDIVNYKTPDPWSFFYAREALGIKTWDIYDDIIGSFSGKYGSVLSVGGDEEILDSSKRKANRFKPVVKFMGPFELKSRGKNTHKVTLPPYVGSVRVMLVSKHEEAYGHAEKSVPVRAPLMLISSLPRVVSVGEKIALPVNIFAMEKNVKNVTVKVETTGKIKLSGQKSKTIRFDEPGDQLCFFDLATESVTGIEKITVTATSKGYTTKEEIEIDVRNPNPPIIVRQSGLIEKSKSQSFTYDLGNVFSENNWVKLEVSRIPSIDINSRFDYLYNYDHYCSEQLVSKAFPLLYIEQFKELSEKESELIKKNVREAILKLYSRQLNNGSFSYWPNDTHPNDWVSSYAGNFLVMAKEKGYEVNAGVLNRWKKYQKQTAQKWNQNKNNNSHFTYDQSDLNQAYRLYTIALEGTPDLGAMNRMKGLKDLSSQAKWRLAAAYSLAGQKAAAEELVFNVSSEFNRYSSSNTSYGSPMRDNAMLLETLILMGRMEEAFKIAQKIARELSISYYNNTQTTAYSLIAMGRLAEKMAGSLEFDWTMNGKKQTGVRTAKASFVKDLPPKPSKGTVLVENQGEGSLYVNLVTKLTPLVDTLSSMNNNIGLEVKYKNTNGANINISEIRQGTELIAEITVSNMSLSENYTDLLLNYIIPSGWEIFNERLISGEDGTSSGNFNYQDIRDDRVITYFDLGFRNKKTFSFRLLASYSGSFALPAVYCEAMYDSDVQARTKAARTTVIR